MINVQKKFLAIMLLIFSAGTINGLAQASKSWEIPVEIDSLASKNDTVKTSVRSPTSAMIRSIIFPGWGQWYNKKYFKAVFAFGAEVGLLANSIYLNQKYVASKTELDREFYINNRNLSNWYLLGVILFSMADAFVDAHLADFDESSDLTSVKIEPLYSGEDIGFQLAICVNFNRP